MAFIGFPSTTWPRCSDAPYSPHDKAALNAKAIHDIHTPLNEHHRSVVDSTEWPDTIWSRSPTVDANCACADDPADRVWDHWDGPALAALAGADPQRREHRDAAAGYLERGMCSDHSRRSRHGRGRS